jgi:hypothetical protein
MKSHKFTRVLFFTIVFALPMIANAQAPGSILFCGGEKTEDCYFKVGQEKTAKTSDEFGMSTPNIYMRAYFEEELGMDTLSISLEKDGEFFKGAESNGYKPEWKSAFINLTNGVWYNNKPFPRGKYCVKITKKVGGTQVVIAKGCFFKQ